MPMYGDQLYLDIFNLQARGWTESLVKRFLGDPDTMLSVNHFSNYTGKRGEKIRTDYGYMLQKPETTKTVLTLTLGGEQLIHF